MTLPRDQIEKGLDESLSVLAALVRPLSAADLATPTRCDGWTVGDVAAHVAGTMASIVAGDFEGLGTPEVTVRDVEQRRGRTAAQFADELEVVNAGARDLLAALDDDTWNSPAPAGLATTTGGGVESLWHDAFVHADDIRHALGRPSELGDGLRASVSHIADVLSERGWGPATLRLDGFEPIEIDGGASTAVTGDPLQFVLIATGRADAASLGLDPSINIYR